MYNPATNCPACSAALVGGICDVHGLPEVAAGIRKRPSAEPTYHAEPAATIDGVLAWRYVMSRKDAPPDEPVDFTLTDEEHQLIRLFVEEGIS